MATRILGLGFDWKEWFLYSKRFWLLIAPVCAELALRIGKVIHIVPAGLDDVFRADATQIILRMVEGLGAYYAAKAAPSLTLSYAKSGGVPEAPFHRLGSTAEKEE